MSGFCWESAQIGSSGRPVLLEAESDVIMENHVGLYHEKARVESRQDGRLFLTNKRLIYVDNANTQTQSVQLFLQNIDHIEYQSKFLKRSARLIIFLDKNSHGRKQPQLDKGTANTKSACSQVVSTWSCPICQAANKTKGKFDEGSEICPLCGINIQFDMVKDNIQYTDTNTPTSTTIEQEEENDDLKKSDSTVPCDTCTFLNHKYMKYCEMCGSKLKSTRTKIKLPSLIINSNNNNNGNKNDLLAFLQISFRKSDGLLFAQATEKILNDLQLNLANSDILLNPNLKSINGVDIVPHEVVQIKTDRIDFVGINGLQKFRETQLLNNDILFNDALQDLNKLMSLANSIEKLYAKQKFTTSINNNNIQDNSNNNSNDNNVEKQIIHTNLIVDREKFYDKDLFLDEIAREIYEFAMFEFRDNNKNLLIPLIDFYVMYNKSMRIGNGLISPEELKLACQRFNKLNLNDLKLLKLNDRILCLATKDSINFIQNEIIQLLNEQPGSDSFQITQLLNNKSSTDHSYSKDSYSNNNIWTIGIINEILKTCTDNGKLVIDKQTSGIYYFENTFWL